MSVRSKLATALLLTVAVIGVLLTAIDMLAWYYGARLY